MTQNNNDSSYNNKATLSDSQQQLRPRVTSSIGNSGGVVSFACGFGYGTTSVFVGQPFDTIKTRMQALSSERAVQIATTIWKNEGITGLYRGGLPMFLGGALFRSAQFGFYENSLQLLKENAPPPRETAFVNYQVVLAGFCGGIGRGLVEGPFEFVKVRRQVQEPWSFSKIYSGSGTTIVRNAVLFMTFAVYLNVLPRYVAPLKDSPFWTGAICANLAWITVWPVDVVKSQIQSGHYRSKNVLVLLQDVISSGKMFRGIVPGLMRSTIANGCGLVVYKKVEQVLST